MHPNSQLLFMRYAQSYFETGRKVLEIGPDGFPSTYNKLISNNLLTWHTLDIYDDSRLTYPNSKEYLFPIPDNTYDIILAGQVMEHVKKIWLWIRELERVCAKGGHIMIISPISWPYHEVPVDCWRIYPEGMKALLSETNLKIIDCRFESLEAAKHSRHLPGKTISHYRLPLRLFYRAVGHFGFPVPCAYDLITIAQK